MEASHLILCMWSLIFCVWRLRFCRGIASEIQYLFVKNLIVRFKILRSLLCFFFPHRTQILCCFSSMKGSGFWSGSTRFSHSTYKLNAQHLYWEEEENINIARPGLPQYTTKIDKYYKSWFSRGNPFRIYAGRGGGCWGEREREIVIVMCRVFFRRWR